jgi:hypothetical protein
MWSSKRLKKIRKRIVEVLSVPTMILFGFVLRIFLSFTSWIRAILLTWGVVDGVASNYMYKHEKFFPYQFLRYGRIVANTFGIVNPFIAVVWNIGDGFYSLYLYKNSVPIEDLPRFGRILNGSLLAIV